MPANGNGNKLYDTFRDYDTVEESARRHDILDLFKRCPIPDEDILSNLALYSHKIEIARLIHLHEIYCKVLDVPGVIMEFGVRWGQNLALFEAFRGIHEPFNRNRKIIGFDTFQGFPSVSDKDADASPGEYSVTPGYENYLKTLLATREREGTLAHLERFELIKGDASITVGKYLEDHPETIISLAFFDFDIYQPTKAVLEAIQPYLSRGSIIVLDELGDEHFPGETVALRDVFGLNKIRLIHSTYSSNRAYFIYE